jgi:hypothetical protein
MDRQSQSVEDGFTRPLREFLDEFDRDLRREQGWLRWAWNKARARVMIGWRLRLHYWLHPEAITYVSQEAFDAFSADDLRTRASHQQERDRD